jgi:heterotetrameric sarcosine oxidase gamma subunit
VVDLSDTQSAEAIITDCAARLQELLHSATDASAALMCFALEGPSARLLLGMGSGIDFDARSFGTEHCVSTRFARIPALIRAVAPDSFELYVDRSLDDYLTSWFAYACRDPIFDTENEDRSGDRPLALAPRPRRGGLTASVLATRLGLMTASSPRPGIYGNAVRQSSGAARRMGC